VSLLALLKNKPFKLVMYVIHLTALSFPSRYENHSPSTTAGNGNANSGLDRIVKSERNNGSANEANDDDRELMDESTDVSCLKVYLGLVRNTQVPLPNFYFIFRTLF